MKKLLLLLLFISLLSCSSDDEKAIKEIPEKFDINDTGPSEGDFEDRMDAKLLAMSSSLSQLEELVTDLDKREHLKDVLSQAGYDYDEMPKSHMVESEILQEKKILEELVEELSNSELSNDQKEELILKKLPPSLSF
jgi:hypothetical protein